MHPQAMLVIVNVSVKTSSLYEESYGAFVILYYSETDSVKLATLKDELKIIYK